MTWTAQQFQKARRLLDSYDIDDPEVRSRLEQRVREHEQSNEQKPTGERLVGGSTNYQDLSAGRAPTGTDALEEAFQLPDDQPAPQPQPKLIGGSAPTRFHEMSAGVAPTGVAVMDEPLDMHQRGKRGIDLSPEATQEAYRRLITPRVNELPDVFEGMTENEGLSSASKREELFSPPEYMPPGFDAKAFLEGKNKAYADEMRRRIAGGAAGKGPALPRGQSPGTGIAYFHEPSISEFREYLKRVVEAPYDTLADQLDTNSSEYKAYADAAWQAFVAKAEKEGHPAIRSAYAGDVEWRSKVDEITQGVLEKFHAGMGGAARGATFNMAPESEQQAELMGRHPISAMLGGFLGASMGPGRAAGALAPKLMGKAAGPLGRLAGVAGAEAAVTGAEVGGDVAAAKLGELGMEGYQHREMPTAKDLQMMALLGIGVPVGLDSVSRLSRGLSNKVHAGRPWLKEFDDAGGKRSVLGAKPTPEMEEVRLLARDKAMLPEEIVAERLAETPRKGALARSQELSQGAVRDYELADANVAWMPPAFNTSAALDDILRQADTGLIPPEKLSFLKTLKSNLTEITAAWKNPRVARRGEGIVKEPLGSPAAQPHAAQSSKLTHERVHRRLKSGLDEEAVSDMRMVELAAGRNIPDEMLVDWGITPERIRTARDRWAAETAGSEYARGMVDELDVADLQRRYPKDFERGTREGTVRTVSPQDLHAAGIDPSKARRDYLRMVAHGPEVSSKRQRKTSGRREMHDRDMAQVELEADSRIQQAEEAAARTQREYEEAVKRYGPNAPELRGPRREAEWAATDVELARSHDSLRQNEEMDYFVGPKTFRPRKKFGDTALDIEGELARLKAARKSNPNDPDLERLHRAMMEDRDAISITVDKQTKRPLGKMAEGEIEARAGRPTTEIPFSEIVHDWKREFRRLEADVKRAGFNAQRVDQDFGTPLPKLTVEQDEGTLAALGQYRSGARGQGRRDQAIERLMEWGGGNKDELHRISGARAYSQLKSGIGAARVAGTISPGGGISMYAANALPALGGRLEPGAAKLANALGEMTDVMSPKLLELLKRARKNSPYARAGVTAAGGYLTGSSIERDYSKGPSGPDGLTLEDIAVLQALIESMPRQGEEAQVD